MSQTPLDQAARAMLASDSDEAARLVYYRRLAASEMFLVLEEEPRGETVSPLILTPADGAMVLLFDREDRLADFMGAPAPYLGLSGRKLAQMLKGQGLGLAINLGVDGAEVALPADALDWICDSAPPPVDLTQTRIRQITPPSDLPEVLLQALDERLAGLAGQVETAVLALVEFENASRGHVLALGGVAPEAEHAIADSIAEALGFSGVEAGALDVLFLTTEDPHLAAFRKTGLAFEIATAPQPSAPKAPGSDPERPPILR